MPRARRRLILAGLLVLALLALALWRSEAFSLDRFDLQDQTFDVAGHPVAGTLVLPPERASAPVVVIVHGDGPQTRWSDGGYLPLVTDLLSAGIGVFSWDKPGTGDSPGDWLDQSMADRSRTAAAALAHVRAQSDGPVGYLGFSQAGWVVPAATQIGPPPDFTVLVGAAVDWRDQGAYFTAQRLDRAGVPAEDAAKIVAEELAANDALFGTGAPATGARADMDPRRFAFVARAYGSDATADIAAMRGPVLALWGSEDLNVDPVRNAAAYAAQLPPQGQTRIIPGASHPLLRAHWFNSQLAGEWGVLQRLAFLALGPYSYAPDARRAIKEFILDPPPQTEAAR